MEWLVPIVVCMLVGVVLLLVEVFMPGFGIPGISGCALLGAGIIMTWIQFGAKVGLGVTVVVLALLAILISIAMRSVAKGKLGKSEFVLNDDMSSEREEKDDMLSLIGEVGEVSTVLRPVGVAEFECGRLNVMTEGEYIERGAKVKITRVDGTNVFVKKV